MSKFIGRQGKLFGCGWGEYPTAEAQPDLVEERPETDGQEQDVDREYPSICLFDRDELEAAQVQAEALDKENRRRLVTYLCDLGRLGAFRRLTVAPDITLMQDLKLRFPHFSAVIDEISLFLQLARLGDDEFPPLSFPPILLLGDPGVGKTFFAKALADVFATPFFEAGMASQTAGFVLSGLDMGWANGKVGLVFRALAQSEVANPMILLDEIDKAAMDSRHDPLGPLYGLLEPGSAHTFQDEAVPVALDARHILWVATANDLANIPQPILSRLTVHEISMPTLEEGMQIAHMVWRDLRNSEPWGRHFHLSLDEGVAEILAKQSPRLMRRVLMAAAARAASRRSHYLKASDIQVSACDSAPRRMGF